MQVLPSLAFLLSFFQANIEYFVFLTSATCISNKKFYFTSLLKILLHILVIYWYNVRSNITSEVTVLLLTCTSVVSQ